MAGWGIKLSGEAISAVVTGMAVGCSTGRLGVVGKLLRLLPNGLFDRVLAGRPRKHRQGE